MRQEVQQGRRAVLTLRTMHLSFASALGLWEFFVFYMLSVSGWMVQFLNHSWKWSGGSTVDISLNNVFCVTQLVDAKSAGIVVHVVVSTEFHH